jgi:predicted GNAT family acetyltransferase
MLIQHKQVGDKGMFFVQNEGAILAEMSYTMGAGDKMIIEHTEVSDELRGKKVGNQLVETAVEYARAHHIKIRALCQFAHAVLKRNSEYSDVLSQND